MAQTQDRLICCSSDVQERGIAWRFEVSTAEYNLPAFIIRYHGQVYGYINRCRHRPVQLDWREGDVFDLTGQYLICSMHGACYSPESGRCVSGPCKGKRLIPLVIKESNGMIYLLSSPSLTDLILERPSE